MPFDFLGVSNRLILITFGCKCGGNLKDEDEVEEVAFGRGLTNVVVLNERELKFEVKDEPDCLTGAIGK